MIDSASMAIETGLIATAAYKASLSDGVTSVCEAILKTVFEAE